MADSEAERSARLRAMSEDHVRRYIESDGADGHFWRMGLPTLVLSTIGRRSGQVHRTALIYGQDGDRYVIVASRGGSDHHPHWYLNLTANDVVDVQVGDQRFRARARTAAPEEKPRLISSSVASPRSTVIAG